MSTALLQFPEREKGLPAAAVASNVRNLLTCDEVAEELRLSKASVNRLIHGQIAGVPALPTVKIGRRYMVRREALIRFMMAAEGVHSSQ